MAQYNWFQHADKHWSGMENHHGLYDKNNQLKIVTKAMTSNKFRVML